MLYDIIKYTPSYITLFWGILLLIEGIKGDKAKLMLSMFMATAFLLYFSHAIYFSQNTKLYLFFDPIYTFVALAVYPLIYWYVKLITVERKCNPKNFWLFLPALFVSLTSIVLYLVMDGTERQEYVNKFLFHTSDVKVSSGIIQTKIYTHIIERITFLFIVLYTVLKSNQLIIRYNKQISNHYSETKNKTIGWLRVLIWGLSITALASISFTLVGRCTFLDCKYLLAFPSLIFSVLLFIIGYFGYNQDLNISNLDLHDPVTSHIKSQDTKGKDELIINLNRLFDNDKIYRKQELKITELANSMNSNRTYISNLINTEFGCSFNEFVNGYRIKEAIHLIKQDSSEDLDQIAEKVGYGSSSTFFRTFKQQEGITPNKFKALIEQQNQLN